MEQSIAAFAAGHVYAYQAGPISGLLLPGACTDQHQIHFSTLEGGPRTDGKFAAHSNRHSIILVCPKHPLKACTAKLISPSVTNLKFNK